MNWEDSDKMNITRWPPHTKTKLTTRVVAMAYRSPLGDMSKNVFHNTLLLVAKIDLN